MKKIILYTLVVFSASCAGLNPITGPIMTPEMQRVQPVDNPDVCQYIDSVYYEVSQPAWINKYAAKNVVAAGGDSYKIMNTSYQGSSMGVQIIGVNLDIYKCQGLSECPDRSKYTVSTIEAKTPEEAQTETTGSEKSASDRLKELQELKDNGLITNQEYQRKRTGIIDGI